MVQTLSGNCVSYTHGKDGIAGAAIVEVPCSKAYPWVLWNYKNGSQLRQYANLGKYALGYSGDKLILVPHARTSSYFEYDAKYTVLGTVYYRTLFMHSTGHGRYWQVNGIGKQLTLAVKGSYKSYLTYDGCTHCQPDAPAEVLTAHRTLTYHSISIGWSEGTLCIDDPGDSMTNGTKLQLWTCLGDDAQEWVATPSTWGDGTYYQLILKDSNKCLDDPGDSNVNGTRVQTWTCNEDAAQAWSPLQFSNFAVWLNANAFNGDPNLPLALDETNGGTANGTPLQVWHENNDQDQMWCGPGMGCPYGSPVLQRVLTPA